MGKKRLWQALFAVAVLLLVGVWGNNQATERKVLENYLLAQYQRSFCDLADGVQNIEVLLSKTMVVNDNLDQALLAQIGAEAKTTQSNITNLPVQDIVAARTAKFLTQVGDYAAVMSLRDSGKRITDEDRQTLAQLHRQAQDLNKQLQTIENRVSDGSIHLIEMMKEARSGLKRGQETFTVASKSFDEVNKTMDSYPTLIYDGPFSDHLEKRLPVSLPGDDVAPDQIRKNALDFIEKDFGTKYQTRLINNIKGSIPAYGVEITTEDKNSPGAFVAVSKKGGQPVWMIVPHVPDGNKRGNDKGNSQGKWSLENTRDKAAKFLADRGFKDMEAVGHQSSGGLITHVFVPLQGATLVYSEPVKVTVAQDNGSVTGFEATEYMMMHHARKLPAPKISLREARSKLRADLNVEAERLAVITTDALEELLAYEFRVTANNQKFLIYINAENGREEKISRVIEGPDGISTI